LDQPGEFYFDETTGDLYYYPREGEDMATAEVYASELEELIAFTGNSLIDKVENIAFESITFAHVAWYGEMTDGFFLQQASTYWNDEGTAYTEYIPGGINLTNTNNIQFTDSVFKGFHGGALALNSGADNTLIVGNVFEDIGDSAIVVGNPEIIKDEQVSGGRNYTDGKPVTSFLMRDYDVVDHTAIADDVTGIHWWEYTAGMKLMGNFTKPTFEVDLGSAQNIEYIKMVADGFANTGYTIYGSATKLSSNTELEASADVLSTVASSDNAVGNTEVIITLSDGHKAEDYRYVYYVAEDLKWKALRKFRVYDAQDVNISNGAKVTYFFESDFTAKNYTHITDSTFNGGIDRWEYLSTTDGENYVGGFTRPTFQVDMGELYSIDKIELQTDGNSWVTQVSHTIYASQDPMTSTADLETYADKIVCIPSDESLAQGEFQTYMLDDQYRTKQYRYLYYQEDASYSDVRRFAAINESLVNTNARALPKGNTITDNYITRCGLVNGGAPGITAYYTHDLDCSYNELYDLPYSGVSLGWGWVKGYEESVASGNRVAYNDIHNVMQIMWDGGAIYTLGHLNGSEITGNHIYDVPNVLGGIYQDTGSAGLDIYKNVVENVPNAFVASKLYNGDGQFLHYYDNYISASESYNGETVGAIFFNPGDYPLEAAEVVIESGIRDEYVGIKVKDSGRQEELTPKVIFTNVMNGDDLVISNEIYRRYILIVHTLYLDKFIEHVDTDGSVGSYPAELVQAVKDQRAVCEQLQTVVPPNRVAMAEATAELQRLLIELRESRVTDTLDDLIAQAEDRLANADVGTQVGQIYQTTYDELAAAVAVSKATLESGDVSLADRVYLEKSIEKYDNEKIALEVLSFDLSSGLMSAEIDSANYEINIKVRKSLDLTSVAPIIGIPSSVVMSPASGEAVDLSDLTETYTIATTDGTASQVWTLNVDVEPVVEGVIALDAQVEDPTNWVTSLGGNEDKYHGQLFGDSTITFNLKVDKHGAVDYPGFTFRNSDFDQYTSNQFYGVGKAYTVIFNTDDDISVELQRWDNKNRTWLADNWGVSGNVIFAKDIFNWGEENEIELTTENVTGGVHILMKVNGQTVIDYNDISADAITDPGYLGTFYVSQPVKISAAD